MDFLLDLVQVDVSDGVLAIEDTGDVFEGGTLGFDVEEIHEDKFDHVPKLEISLVG